MTVFRPIITRRAQGEADPAGDEEALVVWKSILTYRDRETACERAMQELSCYNPDVVPSHSPEGGWFAVLAADRGLGAAAESRRGVVHRDGHEFSGDLRGKTEARARAAAMLSELSADALELPTPPEARFQPIVRIDGGSEIAIGPPVVGLGRGDVIIANELAQLRVVVDQRDGGDWHATIRGDGKYLKGVVWQTASSSGNPMTAWRAAALVFPRITSGVIRVRDETEDMQDEPMVVASA